MLASIGSVIRIQHILPRIANFLLIYAIVYSIVLYTVEKLPDEYRPYTGTRQCRGKNTRVLTSIQYFFGPGTRVPVYHPGNRLTDGYPRHYFSSSPVLSRHDKNYYEKALKRVVVVTRRGHDSAYIHDNSATSTDFRSPVSDRLRDPKSSLICTYVFVGSKHRQVRREE